MLLVPGKRPWELSLGPFPGQSLPAQIPQCPGHEHLQNTSGQDPSLLGATRSPFPGRWVGWDPWVLSHALLVPQVTCEGSAGSGSSGDAFQPLRGPQGSHPGEPDPQVLPRQLPEQLQALLGTGVTCGCCQLGLGWFILGLGRDPWWLVWVGGLKEISGVWVKSYLGLCKTPCGAGKVLSSDTWMKECCPPSLGSLHPTLGA